MSAQSYWLCRRLAEQGNQVTVVTNAAEVEPEYRMWLGPDDLRDLQGSYQTGGSVRVLWTEYWDEWRWHHIPSSNPMLSKLASLAIDAVRAQQADLILSYYLEPYGQAAAIAAQATGVRWLTKHAGSDRYRLLNNPELGTYYKHVLRAADGVITTGDPLLGLAVEADKLIDGPAEQYIPPQFSNGAKPLDLNVEIQRFGAYGNAAVTNNAPLSADKAIIGAYGKVGRTKGTFDLLEAFARSPELRSRAQLVLMCGGPLMSKVREFIAREGLDSEVWTIPFMPHWRVPEFIRACKLICFLERQFAIPQHGPNILHEISACGGQGLVSGEIAAKNSTEVAENPNIHVIPDPTDIALLAKTILQLVGNEVLPTVDMDRVTPERIVTADRRLSELATQIAAFAKKPIGENYRSSVTSIESPSAVGNYVDELLKRYAPTIDSVAGNDIRRQIADHAWPLDAYFLTHVVGAVDQVVAARTGHADYDILVSESDLLWMSCDIESVQGAARFSLPIGALPDNIAAPSTWSAPDGRYKRCWLTTNSIRYRRYSANTVRHILDKRKASEAARGKSAATNLDGLESGQRTHSVLVVKQGNLEGNFIVVHESVASFLQSCDGTRSPDEILRGLADEFSEADTIVSAAIENLQRFNIIKSIWYPLAGPTAW
ncbi:glycosyltransferase [Nocardia vinacea]|uniref:glycosyltransferase n=1 Tax=Nocardia vinacea TaxID=96468 RepID=UPI00146CCD49|nr:glycosyltransferase [Nocardia vinacea]